jgi:Ser-tRNA(Ala) deacylase AlaX
MFDVDRRPSSYSVDFDAVIEGVHRNWIVLDRTNFRPESAERESDIGVIGDVPVNQVVEGAGGLLMHQLARSHLPHTLELGSRVHCRVDWCRRFTMMRLHSAQHLAYLGFEAVHGPAKRQGRRVAAAYSFVEVEPLRPFSAKVAAAAISAWIQRVVADDLLITALSRGSEPNRRYWHVDGVGTVACSGHHPETTGEVGPIHLEVCRDGNGLVRLTTRLKPG